MLEGFCLTEFLFVFIEMLICSPENNAHLNRNCKQSSSHVGCVRGFKWTKSFHKQREHRWMAPDRHRQLKEMNDAAFRGRVRPLWQLHDANQSFFGTTNHSARPRARARMLPRHRFLVWDRERSQSCAVPILPAWKAEQRRSIIAASHSCIVAFFQKCLSARAHACVCLCARQRDEPIDGCSPLLLWQLHWHYKREKEKAGAGGGRGRGVLRWRGRDGGRDESDTDVERVWGRGRRRGSDSEGLQRKQRTEEGSVCERACVRIWGRARESDGSCKETPKKRG